MIEDELIFELAFFLEDPCGLPELELARALLKLGRVCKPENRFAWARMIEGMVAVCEGKSVQSPNVDSTNSGNHGGIPIRFVSTKEEADKRNK